MAAGLLYEPRQRIEPGAQVLEFRGRGTVGQDRERIALGGERLELGHRWGADLLERGGQRHGLSIDALDDLDLAAQCHHVRGQRPDAVALAGGGLRFPGRGRRRRRRRCKGGGMRGCRSVGGTGLCRNAGRNGVDLGLERLGARGARIALVLEVRHVLEQVLARGDDRALGLELAPLGRGGAVFGSHLGIERLELGLQFRLALLQCLRQRRCAVAAAFGGGRTAEELRIGACNLETQTDHFVGGLAVGEYDQLIAGLGGVLLLRAERAVPLHGLIQDLDDLRRRQRRGGGLGSIAGSSLIVLGRLVLRGRRCFVRQFGRRSPDAQQCAQADEQCRAVPQSDHAPVLGLACSIARQHRAAARPVMSDVPA